jgi:hypothetical protein
MEILELHSILDRRLETDTAHESHYRFTKRRRQHKHGSHW